MGFDPTDFYAAFEALLVGRKSADVRRTDVTPRKRNPVTRGLRALLERYALREGEATYLLSLGCGGAEIEYEAIENLGESVGFVGVERAPERARQASERFLGATVASHVVCGDFTDAATLAAARAAVPDGARCVFAVVGGTFCNFDPEALVALITGAMREGDMLFVEGWLWPRDAAGVANLHARCERYQSTREAHFAEELRAMGVSIDWGRLRLVRRAGAWGEPVWSCVFTLDEPALIDADGDTIELPVGYEIELMTLRTIAPGALRAISEAAGLHVVTRADTALDGVSLGHFLFERRSERAASMLRALKSVLSG